MLTNTLNVLCSQFNGQWLNSIYDCINIVHCTCMYIRILNNAHCILNSAHSMLIICNLPPLEKMLQMGFTLKEIQESLSENRYDEVCATYMLLKREFSSSVNHIHVIIIIQVYTPLALHIHTASATCTQVDHMYSVPHS